MEKKQQTYNVSKDMIEKLEKLNQNTRVPKSVLVEMGFWMLLKNKYNNEV